MWTINTEVILWIFIFFLIALTYSVFYATKAIPGMLSINPLYIFIGIFFILIALALLIYLIGNYILSPILKVSQIDYSTAVFYLLIFIALCCVLTALVAPSKIMSAI